MLEHAGLVYRNSFAGTSFKCCHGAAGGSDIPAGGGLKGGRPTNESVLWSQPNMKQAPSLFAGAKCFVTVDLLQFVF